MAVISGPLIQQYVETSRRDGDLPYLSIEPFDPVWCGPNSFDIHLGETLRTYDLSAIGYLDTRRETPTVEVPFPADGFVIRPGEFYLASTREYIECHGLVPWVDGRSSVGRLSVSIHQTAGRGDDGFRGVLTLELSAVLPVKIYPGDRIGQLTFFTLEGDRKPYSGRYLGDTGPVASRMHLDGGS